MDVMLGKHRQPNTRREECHGRGKCAVGDVVELAPVVTLDKANR